MGAISRKDVEYVAGLAQLSLDEATSGRLVQELGAILEYMDKLNALDTSGVEPMIHVLDLANVYRDDEVGAPLERGTALANAPKSDGAYFLVPRILDTA